MSSSIRKAEYNLLFWFREGVAIGLGIFFIQSAGRRIFFPVKRGASDAPEAFSALMKSFAATEYFLPMIRWTELIAGLLLVIPQTRLIGALLLLPVLFNVFAMHLMLDDRMGEVLLTGLLFALNTYYVLVHFRRLILPSWRNAVERVELISGSTSK